VHKGKSGLDRLDHPGQLDHPGRTQGASARVISAAGALRASA